MEPRIWLTSDWHLGHDREFIWKARGFNSVEDMNETIITIHNNLVSENDDVYVLGDLTLGPATNIELIEKMNGKLHIVRGNHDTDARWAAYTNLPNIVELQNAIYLKYNKYHFYMSHYPSLTGNLEKESLQQMTLNLYGHTHQKNNFYMDMPYMYHVGVDSHNCIPISLDQIIEDMIDKVEECKYFLDVKKEDEYYE
jgi:calcineurin-like phosphoesterase family protein